MKSSGDSDDKYDDVYFRAFQHTTRLQSADPPQTIETNNVTVSRLVAVPKRSVFVAACLDFVLRVYQYGSTSNPAVLSGGHKGAVMDVIHLYDDVLASVALDGSICTWKIGAIGANAKKSPKSPKSPTAPAPAQHALVDSLRLGKNERATSIASLNSNHLVVGTESGKLIILKHKARGEALHVAKTLHHTDSVLRIAAMENDYFVSVSRDRTAGVWNTTNISTLRKPIAELTFDSPVVSVAMNHEHHLIALGTATGALHVYYISDVNSVEKVFQLGDVDFCLNSIRFVTNDILSIACLSGCVAFVSISKQKAFARIALDRSSFLMDTAPLGDGRLVAVGMRNFSAVFQIPDAILDGKITVADDTAASTRSSKKVNPVRSTSSKRGMRIKGGPVVKSSSSKKGIRLRNSTGGTAAAAATAAGENEARETLVLRKGASNSSLSAMADEARRSVTPSTSPATATASSATLSAMAEEARRANNTDKEQPSKKGPRTDRARQAKNTTGAKREEIAVVRPSLSKKGIIRRKASRRTEEETPASSFGSKRGIRKGRSATNISGPAETKNDRRIQSTLGHGDDFAKVKANLRPAATTPVPAQSPARSKSKKGIRVRGPTGSNRGIAMKTGAPLTSIPTSPVSGKLVSPLPFAPMEQKRNDASPPSIPLPSSLFGHQRLLPSTIVANQKMAAVNKVTSAAQSATQKRAPQDLDTNTGQKIAPQVLATTPPASTAPQAPTAATTSRQPPVIPPPSPSVDVKNKSLPLPPPVLPLSSPTRPKSQPFSNPAIPGTLRSPPPPPPPMQAFGSRLVAPTLPTGRSPPPPPPPPVAQNGGGNRSGVQPKSKPTPPQPPVIGNASRPNSSPVGPAHSSPPPLPPKNTRAKSTPQPPPVSGSKPDLQPAKRRVTAIVETPVFMMPTPAERATMTANTGNRKKIPTDPTQELNGMSLPIIQIFNADDENENEVTSVWEERRNALPQTAKKKSSGSSHFSGGKDKSNFESLLEKFNNSFQRRRNTDLNTRRV